MRIEDWPDRTLAEFGRLMLRDNGPEARAVRAEMQRRIDAAQAPVRIPCYTVQRLRAMALTGEKPEPSPDGYVIDHGPTRRE